MTMPYSGQGWRHNALPFESCTMSSTLTPILAYSLLTQHYYINVKLLNITLWKKNDNPRIEPREEGYSMILHVFHSMSNINYIKEFQLITSAGPDVSTSITPKCYMLSPLRKINHHIWSQLPVLSTDRLHPPNLTNATCFVHWERPYHHI
jgi:hypothetical protein